jgi:hypothetical protein
LRSQEGRDCLRASFLLGRGYACLSVLSIPKVFKPKKILAKNEAGTVTWRLERPHEHAKGRIKNKKIGYQATHIQDQ